MGRVGPSGPPSARRMICTTKKAVIEPASPAMAGVTPAIDNAVGHSLSPPTIAIPATIAASASAVAARRLNYPARMGTNRLTPMMV